MIKSPVFVAVFSANWLDASNMSICVEELRKVFSFPRNWRKKKFYFTLSTQPRLGSVPVTFNHDYDVIIDGEEIPFTFFVRDWLRDRVQQNTKYWVCLHYDGKRSS